MCQLQRMGDGEALPHRAKKSECPLVMHELCELESNKDILL